MHAGRPGELEERDEGKGGWAEGVGRKGGKEGKTSSSKAGRPPSCLPTNVTNPHDESFTFLDRKTCLAPLRTLLRCSIDSHSEQAQLSPLSDSPR